MVHFVEYRQSKRRNEDAWSSWPNLQRKMFCASNSISLMLPRGAAIGAYHSQGTAVTILRQDIDFTKLLDAPDAIRVFGSVAVCHFILA